MNRRLPPKFGEWIDRGKPVSFIFNGVSYSGFAGDTIASALYANDVRLLGRSFKYHRARGCYSFAGHDSNAMLTDGTRTNIRADATPLTSGMNLRPVNIFGTLQNDWMNITEKFSKFMPVGFYYKAFHRPAWLFPFHERQIRKIAGLGAINPRFAATRSPKDYAWCDVLVVGGGAAGLAAARSAGETGARVILVEEQPKLGGSLTCQFAGDASASEAMLDHIGALSKMSNVEIRTGTMVGGHYADHWIALFDETKLTKLRAGAVVYATGAIEQPAVFGNNDLPGVMLATAAQRLIHLYAIKPFTRAVILAGNSDAYAAALDLRAAGVDVAAIVDLRAAGDPSPLAEQAAAAKITIFRGHTIYEAVSAKDKNSITSATIAPINLAGEADIPRAQHIPCDGIAVSVGWTPNSSLLSQAGVKFRHDESLEQLVPWSSPKDVFPAGRVNGIYALADQFADGRRAGLAAAAVVGKYTGTIPATAKTAGSAASHPYPIFKHADKKNFVEFDEDVHLTDFVNAHQEGFDSVELMKRYSTVGMGPSQGKLSNMNAVRILAKLNGKSINETGTTTARPFYQPVPIGPSRRPALPSDAPYADARLAQRQRRHILPRRRLVPPGILPRRQYPHLPARCIFAEANQVRTSLGMIDVSTLGKLLVNGPDAATFLERIYTGNFSKLAVGKFRYGVAVDESGIIIEDGVIARLAADRFYVTATSSGVAAFYREMLRYAILWKMNVTLSNVTGQYAAMNIAGPKSRDVLSQFTSADLGSSAFPYLGVREETVCGVRAILMRVGFVGELGYEVHVPAGYGQSIWTTLFNAGQVHKLRPFGVDAQRLLRLEKGHIIISQDTDALTTPYEAEVAWTIGKDKTLLYRATQLCRSTRKTQTQAQTRRPAAGRKVTLAASPKIAT